MALVKVVDLKIIAQSDDARRQLDVIAARAEAIGKLDPTIKVRVDSQAVTAGLAVLNAETAKLAKNVNMNVNSDGLVVATARAKAANAALQSMIVPANNAGRVWGFLGTKVLLFGGAFEGILPKLLTQVGVWHILTDVVVEFLAVAIPAGIAFGAFGVAAIPTIQAITAKMTNLNTITEALGVNVYPLTGGFANMAAAVQPKVYDLFGEALVLISAKTGEFTKLATGAGTALDQLGGRAVAALTSGGLTVFLKNAVSDLSRLGDVAGNVGGIIGNLLKAMPGYAEVILTSIDSATKVLETVSGAAVPIIHLGLAAHGAVLYIGLLSTAATYLVRGGLSLIGGLAASGVTGLARLGLAGSAASKGLLGIQSAVGSLAGLPWGFILVAVAGLAILTVHLLSAKDATQNWIGNLQQLITSGPTIAAAITLIGSAQQQTATALNSAAVRMGELTVKTGPFVSMATRGSAAYQEQARKVNDLTSGLQGFNAQQDLVGKRVAWLSHEYGGNAAAMGLMNQAGITSAQITGTNTAQWKAAEVQIRAAADALMAMGDSSIPRVNAAENALGNTFLTSTLPSIQKVTTAEDNLISTVLGGRQAFISLQQGFAQLAVDAGISSGALKLNLYTLRITGQQMVIGQKQIGGLSAASLQLASDYYGTVIPAAQKQIDALQQQGISTANLRTATATTAGELESFAGKNVEARSVIVDLINGALGPGTVSLKTLNAWVKANSTTMAGFNAIIAKSTIQAGTLAGTLQSDLNVQFRQDLLAASGASGQLRIFTADLAHNRQNTAAGHGDRARLITDLENSGLSAKQAAAYVDGLSRSLTHIPKTEHSAVSVTGTGAWSVTNVGPGGPGHKVGAKGMLVSGGVAGKDSVPILAMPGEVLVPTSMVAAGAVDHLRGRLPGFAAGGVVGNYSGSVPGQTTWLTSEYAQTVKAIQAATAAATAAGIQAAAQAASIGAGAAGPGGGAPSANAALARRLMPAWSAGAPWAAWNYVEMREAGWNQFARNPASGAYGIPQALPPSKMGAAANPPESNPTAQIRWMISYIQQRYGGPQGAAAHEMAFSWYDKGGMIPKGLSLALNTSGRAEHVVSGSQLDDLIGSVETGNHLLGQLIGVTADAPAGFAGVLTGAARTSMYKSLYST